MHFKQVLEGGPPEVTDKQRPGHAMRGAGRVEQVQRSRQAFVRTLLCHCRLPALSLVAALKQAWQGGGGPRRETSWETSKEDGVTSWPRVGTEGRWTWLDSVLGLEPRPLAAAGAPGWKESGLKQESGDGVCRARRPRAELQACSLCVIATLQSPKEPSNEVEIG